jgi:hypothetical protein
MMSSTNSIFSNKEKTKWKILSFSLIGILIASITATAMLFHIAPQTMTGPLTGQQLVDAPPLVNEAYGAGVLTNVFALPADNIFSTKTYYTIAFTTATSGAIRDIEMTFPAGFNVASAKLLEVQGIGAGSLSVLGQVVKYTVSSAASVPAQRAIKISLADITNSATTSNQVAVTTKAFSGPNIVIIDGPTNSAVFTLIQVSNPMIGANTITAPKLTANSIDNTKILDGQVTVADLAANSVDANKVRDGSIGKAEVSTAFIKKVTIQDQNTYGGWNPDNSAYTFHIADTEVRDGSVISVTLFPNDASIHCDGYPNFGGDGHANGIIFIECNNPPQEGYTLSYTMTN